MANQETKVMHEIMKALSGIVVLFRNSIGFDKAHKSRYGIGGKGGSDLIGWNSIRVTPEMVGKKIAVFTALEVKANNGRPTPEQLHFINTVRAAGGIGRVVYGPDDAKYYTSVWFQP